MAHENIGVSRAFEEVYLEENLNIKEEEVTKDETIDTEIACEDILAGQTTVQKLERAFKCDVCPNSFESTLAVVFHKMNHKNSEIHTGEKQYRCDQCGKCFSDSKDLIVHKRIHSGEKSYHCNQCDKSFRHLSMLSRHKRVHSGKKPFQCDQCAKSFSNSWGLRIHERIHTGEKPFQCDQCDMSFSDSWGLKIHERIHTGEKPYQCDQCDKSFVCLSSLTRHNRIHTREKPYQCNRCNQSFRQLSDLTVHRRIHTRQKPYQCDQCRKFFITSARLAIHKRIHLGERPHQCDQYPRSMTIRPRKEHESQLSESEINSLFECMLCDEKFKTKQERSNHITHHWDSCKCEFSEPELQDIRASKPRECTKCGKYTSSESPSKVVSQLRKESTTDQLDPLRISDEAIDSKSSQSVWMSSELKAADVFESVSAFQEVKKEEPDLD